MSDNRQMERKLNVPVPKSLLQANSKTDAKKSTGKLEEFMYRFFLEVKAYWAACDSTI